MCGEKRVRPREAAAPCPGAGEGLGAARRSRPVPPGPTRRVAAWLRQRRHSPLSPCQDPEGCPGLEAAGTPGELRVPGLARKHR